MVDVATGIAAAEAGIDLMNSNKFSEAEEMLRPWQSSAWSRRQ
jgi:hypothetical protein